MFERKKTKKQKVKRAENGETRRSGNIEDKIFVIFEIYPKKRKKDRKFMATNY